MRKQGGNTAKQQYLLPEPNQLKFNNPHEPITQYIQFLRTNIRHLGQQIDSEFHRSSEFIFSLYKHYYSPSQCPGQKDTLLSKLRNCGVQWALQSSLEQRPEEAEVRSEEARSVNPTPSEVRDQDNSKRGYNMRAKIKPQKYRNMEDEFDYGDKSQKFEAPKRGRPSLKKDYEAQGRRDTTNPYEKAPYKKRRSHLQAEQEGNKDESVKDEAARSSAKWDESQDYKDEGNDLGKSAQEMRSELEREGNRDVSQKYIKSVQDVKVHANRDEIDRLSHLVDAYRKNWEQCHLQISLQNQNST